MTALDAHEAHLRAVSNLLAVARVDEGPAREVGPARLAVVLRRELEADASVLERKQRRAVVRAEVVERVRHRHGRRNGYQLWAPFSLLAKIVRPLSGATAPFARWVTWPTMKKRPLPGPAVQASVGAWRKCLPSTVIGREPASSGLPHPHPSADVRRKTVQLSPAIAQISYDITNGPPGGRRTTGMPGRCALLATATVSRCCPHVTPSEVRGLDELLAVRRAIGLVGVVRDERAVVEHRKLRPQRPPLRFGTRAVANIRDEAPRLALVDALPHRHRHRLIGRRPRRRTRTRGGCPSPSLRARAGARRASRSRGRSGSSDRRPRQSRGTRRRRRCSRRPSRPSGGSGGSARTEREDLAVRELDRARVEALGHGKRLRRGAERPLHLGAGVAAARGRALVLGAVLAASHVLPGLSLPVPLPRPRAAGADPAALGRGVRGAGASTGNGKEAAGDDRAAKGRAERHPERFTAGRPLSRSSARRS